MEPKEKRFTIAGAEVFGHRGRVAFTEATLREALAGAFLTEDKLNVFLCKDRGLFSMVVLGPKTPNRVTWAFEVQAPTYRKMRAAMRELGLRSKLREADSKDRWAA